MGLFGGMIEGYDSSQRQRANEANLRYQEELRKRQQMEWANQDAERAKFEETAAAMDQGLNAPRQDFFGMVGAKAPMVEAPTWQQAATTGTGSRELEGLRTPMAAPAMAPRNDAAEEALKSQMAIARAGRRIPDYFNAAATLRKQRVDSDAAAIRAGILNMGDTEYEQLANQVTVDQGNRYKLVPGKNGYSTLELDGTKAKLSREDVANFFAGKHRLAAGDNSGMDEIAKINKDLAAKVAANLAQLKDVSTVNNNAAHNLNVDANNQERLGIERTRANAASAHEKWQRELGKMGAPQVFQKADGSYGTYTPVMNGTTVTWHEMALPQGAKPLKPAPTLTDAEKIGYQKLMDFMATAAPDQVSDPAKLEALYRRFGLDPVKFNVETPLSRAVRAKAEAQGGQAATAGPAMNPGPAIQPPKPTPTAQQRVSELYERLRLPGVSPEKKMEIMAEIRQLEGRGGAIRPSTGLYVGN